MSKRRPNPHLVDVAHNDWTGPVKLTAPTSAAAKLTLRTLDQLGLLNDDMLWSLIGAWAPDPFYVIRTLRTLKDKCGLRDEEHLFGTDVVFLAGDVQDGNYYKTTIHVDVLNDDAAFFTRVKGEHGWDYKLLKQYTGTELTELLSAEAAGDKRVEILINLVKEQLNASQNYQGSTPAGGQAAGGSGGT